MDDGDEGDSDLSADFDCDVSDTTVQFTSSTEGYGGNVMSYSWDFGNGTIRGGPKASQTYVEAGTYKVHFTVRTDDGATVRTVKNVVVPD